MEDHGGEGTHAHGAKVAAREKGIAAADRRLVGAVAPGTDWVRVVAGTDGEEGGGEVRDAPVHVRLVWALELRPSQFEDEAWEDQCGVGSEYDADTEHVVMPTESIAKTWSSNYDGYHQQKGTTMDCGMCANNSDERSTPAPSVGCEQEKHTEQN